MRWFLQIIEDGGGTPSVMGPFDSERIRDTTGLEIIAHGRTSIAEVYRMNVADDGKSVGLEKFTAAETFATRNV
jgi:hypothetical protein